MKWIRWVSGAAMLVLWLGVLNTPRAANAQDYVIGPEDVLQISVWLHPELDRSVTVNADGSIVIAPIGSIPAAGLTAAQLGERLGDRLSSYLRQNITATVTVTQFVSRAVFVSGSVARPGRYGFERMPGLLDVINHAGGALPDADLRRVNILRRDGPTRRVIPIDLSAALQQGTEAGLPALEPGDIVVVPSTTGVGGAATVDAAGVVGEVRQPGLYPVGTGQDLWWVLAQAGGPTDRSNLSTIKIVSRGGDAHRAVTVNLGESLGGRGLKPVLVKPGDIVFVSARGPSLWQGFVSLLSITRDVASVVAIIDVLRK